MKETILILSLLGILLSGMYAILYNLIDYGDTAPVDESLILNIKSAMSRNGTWLTVFFYGCIGGFLGYCIGKFACFIHSLLNRGE